MLDTILYALLALGSAVIIGLIVLIIRAMSEKSSVAEFEEAAAFTPQEAAEPENPEHAKPERPESEQERLKRREKELGEREARVKAERIRELKEREKIIQRREDEEKTPPKPEPRKDELEEERKRILGLIKKAEERFAAGELEENNFKRIVSDYQRQIIDLDVKLRTRKGKGL